MFAKSAKKLNLGDWEDWGYPDTCEYWDDDEYSRREIRENQYDRMSDLLEYGIEITPAKVAPISK